MSELRRVHAAVWGAIDQIAEDHGLSASGLAIEIGMDSTSFNKSKRILRDGHLRWPSTEAIARVLDRTGLSFVEFGRRVERSR